MARARSLALALVLLFAAAPALAATKDFYSALGGSRDGDLVTVEVNKGAPLHLPAAAASVAIANPAIADVQVVSPRLLFINGKLPGETSLIVVDGQDNVILEGNILVTHNLSRLQRAASDMVPGSHIVASSTDNAIILKGTLDSPVESEKVQRLAAGFLENNNQKVINMIDTSGSDQVMLKVKIVELARSELKRFGINWENVANTGNFIFGLAQGRDVVDATGALERNGSDSSLSISHTGRVNINAVIDALETDGLVTVLAEPNLTTRSGMTASFLSGGEIPIPVVQASAGTQPVATIQYQQFGVSLQFTPVVLSKDKISLTVLPEVSALSDENAINQNGFTVPSLTTRRASATIDLGSGQTFALAGLLRDDQGNTVNKFPGLGDIPLIGALFRNSEYSNDQTELVILVTPYIVRPVDSPDKLATPVDGYTPATDAERILMGKLHGDGQPRYPDSERPDASTPAALGGFGGSSGFVVK
ncbi:MAG: type II and III secretion system protein family protein [Alphaproteobacteria bacterium]